MDSEKVKKQPYMYPEKDVQSIVQGVPANAEFFDETYMAMERSVVRKLDMTLMPIIFILYMFNYLDRNNIASVEYFPRPKGCC